MVNNPNSYRRKAKTEILKIVFLLLIRYIFIACIIMPVIMPPNKTPNIPKFAYNSPMNATLALPVSILDEGLIYLDTKFPILKYSWPKK